MKTQVIVAGCGPVGSVAGYYLAKAGIDVIVLENMSACSEDLRASTFHPPTLDMMEELGVLEFLMSIGLKAPIYQYRNRQTNEKVELDLTELSDISKNPFRLQCEQFKLTKHLSKLINAHPHGEVRFSNRIVGFDQDDNGVTAFIETPYSIEKIEAEYLIAADGGNSIIRKWLGIEFEGFTYPEKFLCLSTKHPVENHIDGISHVNYIADTNEWVVVLRIPDLWRILVPASNEDDEDYLRSDEKRDLVFRHLLGIDETIETQHRTIYNVHQRVAQKYVVNRVALVGDAAHLNNPLGGFGMNSGIHDAWNLCEKLVKILQNNGNSQALLSLYERQRKAVTVNFIQAQSIRNKQDLELTDQESLKRQQDRFEEIANNDEKRRDYLLHQSMYTSLEDERSII